MDISEETTPNSVSPADDETAEVSPQNEVNNDDYKINEDPLKIINIEKNVDFANKSKQFMNNPTTTPTITTGAADIIKAKYGANIARTETNSHPLMLSPTGTDSEAEEPNVAGQDHISNDNGECPNFPDVIPRDEASNILVYNNISGRLSPNTITTTNKTTAPITTTTAAAATIQHKSINSPDLLSSESEADISPYHTAVESNFQTVALIPNNNNHININHNIHNNHNNNNYNNNNNNNNNNNSNHTHKHNHKLNLITNRSHQQQKQQQQSQKQRIILTGCEDISSLDSISNHSFDNEPNLASLSPSSSLMDIDALNDNENNINDVDDDDDDDHNNDDDGDDDHNDDNVDDDDDDDIINIMHMGLPKTLVDRQHQHNNDDTLILLTSSSSASNDKRRRRRRGANTNTTTTTTTTILSDNNKLPQYSASEEQRDVRNWQKIILTNGTTHEIDMRVIEPYKRVLSHGGYLKAGGHNAIVLFCACHLPDRSRTDYSYVMDNLFLYVVKTLEQLVTEDYVLVYLHGGSDRRSIPPFPWLKKCYQLLDRRLRKSLKNLYLVHPTFWLKSIVWMARPFVSTKFWRKLIYVKSLEELRSHVAIEKAAIPDKVKQYDAKHF